MDKNTSGFTLIELVISLAILSIVVLMAFSIITFGNRTFSKGQDRSDVQFELRMVSSFITEELRNAVEVKIINTIPSPIPTGYNCIYLNSNRIKYIHNGITVDKTTAIVDTNPSDLFNITKLTNDNNVLKFKLENTEQNVSIESEVYFNNVEAIDSNSGYIIYYRRP